jgi:hypothetical protein
MQPQETNFFERRVSAYQIAVQGEICFDASFRGRKKKSPAGAGLS